MEKIILKARPPSASANAPQQQQQQQQQHQHSSSKTSSKPASNPSVLRVHLYKTHFTLASQDRPLPYQGPLSSFIAALNTCSLGGVSVGGAVASSSLAMAAFNPKYWDRGCVRLECIDHRFAGGGGGGSNGNNTATSTTTGTAPTTLAPSSTAVKVKLLIQPSPEAIYQDIQAFGQDHFGTEWDAAEMGIELESKVLAHFFPVLDLDVLDEFAAYQQQPHHHHSDDSSLHVNQRVPDQSTFHVNQRVPSLSSHAQHTLDTYNR